LIAALWLSLAPPEPAPVSEPQSFDEVVDIPPPTAPPIAEPAPVPEPAPPPESEPMPRQPPPDDLRQPPPPPDDLQFRDAVPLKVASDRRRQRRPPREPRDPRQARAPREPRVPNERWRVQGKPWGKTDEWRAWGAPLLSAFLPGMGQLANGHTLKGVGLLYGTIALLGGSIALYVDRSDGTRPLGAEYARLTTYGVLSTALPMMWLAGIADAHRFGKDEDGGSIDPKLDHKLRLSMSRTMAVGFRADPDRPGFYDEWTAALIGQVAPRWSVGLSDLTLKPDGLRVGVVQFGVRADYRVFDRRRVWIDVGLGTAMQVKIRKGRDPLDPELPMLPTQTKFGAIPYGQVDFRWFVLDRMSFDLTPRLSVPMTTRYYSADRALPRFSPILELGASASLYF
jgi:hypothetical protein